MYWVAGWGCIHFGRCAVAAWDVEGSNRMCSMESCPITGWKRCCTGCGGMEGADSAIQLT